MSRKTFSVEQMVEYTNKQLKYSLTGPEFRNGVRCALEQILMETGNYGGFRYLRSDEVPQGHAAGVHYKDGQLLPYPERFINTDDTRIEYFLK